MTTSTAKDVFKLDNPYLTMKDHMYHIGISTTDNIKERFSDVKFVCMGGKKERMRSFAELLYDQLGKPKSSELESEGAEAENCHHHVHRLKNISSSGGRYSMFKVGPVISASHGIGMASLSVVLHELFKLIHFAECKDVKFIRLGTCGGLGLEAGTVVVTKQSYNGMLEDCFKQVACGKETKYDSRTNPDLSAELLANAEKLGIKAISGNTLGTNDFFEEQGRLDGALCNFTNEEKMAFLKRAHDQFGIKNIEMESTCFAALCNRVHVKCAVACVAVLNRLLHDDITEDGNMLTEWELQPQRLVVSLIKQHLSL